MPYGFLEPLVLYTGSARDYLKVVVCWKTEKNIPLFLLPLNLPSNSPIKYISWKDYRDY